MGRLLVVLAAVVVLSACGDDGGDEPAGPPTQEENVVTLDGIRYRVVKFRELNLREGPDRRFYRGSPPGAGEGVYAAFVQACNVSSQVARLHAPLVLLDAGGDRFEALGQREDNVLAYRPLELEPGQCVPRNSTLAEPLSGLVEPFAIPFEDADDLPLSIEFEGDSRTERLEVEA